MQPASTRSSSQPAKQNRLTLATSPYLLQHASNPVDWHEWNAESLARAKAEDKPIFLSIGYAACHWCHVMAHESFESDAVAAVMNRHFINIKVDREERPDLDDIYMQATQLMNQGQGGWPMSVWLTPDGRPFFAGTYFPPESRWGRPGFRQVCERIGELWASPERAQLIAQSEELTNAIREMSSPSASDSAPAALAPDLIDRLADALARRFDSVHGGMSGGGTNKFPPHMAIDLMLRSARRLKADDPGRRRMEDAVRLTLDRMSRGGIYDHLAGGIARYSTDVEWHVPHFEKMLYDQALVSRMYLDASAYFGEPAGSAVRTASLGTSNAPAPTEAHGSPSRGTPAAHATNALPLYPSTPSPLAATARGIFDYVLADLQSPEGGFYSTRDADSEGIEGKYYVWTKAEVRAICEPPVAEAVCTWFDLSDTGNWSDPHEPDVVKSVLRVVHTEEQAAKLLHVSVDELRARIERGRALLRSAREKRVAPGLDDKILAEWNGLMISSLARGGAQLDEPRYVDAASRAADFIFTRQLRDGRLLRAWRGGRTLSVAFLADYAAMIEGCIELFEATFDERWLRRALELQAAADRWHWDDEQGGYFQSPHDHEQLITRAKDLSDGATPSGNSMMLMNLLRLATLTGDAVYQRRGEKLISAFTPLVAAAPQGAERFLSGFDFATHGATEIALIGPREDAATREMLRVIHATYLPNRALMWAAAATDSSTTWPLLRDRPMQANKPTAYICRSYVCERPINEVNELRERLGRKRP